MTSTRAPSRSSASSRSPVLPLFVGVLVVFLGLAAWLTTRGGDEPSDLGDVAPEVTGAALPAFVSSASDTDLTAPVAVGPELLGDDPVTFPLSDRPTIVVFLAHWCEFCQAEVPIVQDWLDTGGLPDGVEIRAVTTSINPARPNYPPDAWLEREGWTVPTLVDDGTVAQAYGLTSFPFWAFVAEDGSVTRAAGQLTAEQLDAVAAGLVP